MKDYLLAVMAVLCCVSSGNSARGSEIRVAAAADLTTAFTEIARAYESKTGVHVSLTFGASGLLTRQVENGAPFDLFAAANTSYLDELVKRKLVLSSDITAYAVGHLGMYTRKSAAPPPASVKDMAKSAYTRIAIANPRVAPYGKAAQEALESAQIWEGVKDRVVMGENIQQALQFAQTGNVDIAIVSASQGKEAGGHFVAIPDKMHNPLVQSMGAIAASPNLTAARAFIKFVAGPDGQAILKKHAFTSAGKEHSASKGSGGAAPSAQ